jgi:hypothetical protein
MTKVDLFYSARVLSRTPIRDREVVHRVHKAVT